MKYNIFGEFRDMLKETLLSDRKQVAKLILVFVIIILAVVIRVTRSNNENVHIDTVEEGKGSAQEVTCIYADISGEVENPGIYKLKEDTRLYELIDKAGGLTKYADLDQINQAETVEDGQKVIIPKETNDGNTGSLSETQESNGKININTASESELTELPGVGSAIAARIVQYRNGSRFKSVEDLKNVSGIGDKTFEKMKDLIHV